MGTKQRRKFSIETKAKAVDSFLRGEKTAAQLAVEYQVGPDTIYSWKAQIEAKRRSNRVNELEAEGHHPADIKRILELEDQLDEYKKKLAEQMLINDLLKKIQPTSSVHLKKSSGSSEITSLLDQSKKLAKR